MSYVRVFPTTNGHVVTVSWSGVEPDVVMDAISAAVTEWFNTTDEGRDVLERFGGDFFNIGHVYEVLKPDPFHSLNQALMRHGVYYLVVSFIDTDIGKGQWKADTPLYKEGRVR